MEVFDFDYCQRDDTVYWEAAGYNAWSDTFDTYDHSTGGVWAAPDITLTLPAGLFRLETPPLGWGPEEVFVTAVEGSTRYCLVCDDRLPTEDLCEHLHWCNGDDREEHCTGGYFYRDKPCPHHTDPYDEPDFEEAQQVKVGQVWQRVKNGWHFRITFIEGEHARTEPVRRDEPARRHLFGEWTFDETGRTSRVRLDRLHPTNGYRLVADIPDGK